MGAGDLVEAFANVRFRALYFPRVNHLHVGARRVDAFLKFDDESERKRAHAKNETYVNPWQPRLLFCSKHALEDSLAEGVIGYDEIEGPGVPRAEAAKRSIPME